MQAAKELLQQFVRKEERKEVEHVATLVHTPTATQPVEARIQRFKDELLAPRINIDRLKQLAFHGIPDKPGLRSVVWKLLLGYLPPNTTKWDEVLAEKRKQYYNFCEDLIIDPKKLSSAAGGSHPSDDDADAEVAELHGRDVTAADHPLSLGQHSVWNGFFKDSEIKEQIERDVMRTHPDMHFFCGDTPEAERHRNEMMRCLFLYAKLNPGLCYIQGMNELLAPLYYLFKSDPDVRAARHAEADAFYCFVDLISEFRDHFCKQLDRSASGIRATLDRLFDLLQHHHPPLWAHLVQRNKIDAQFFAFRWVTLLLTQEFPFPDAVRVWDTLLADPAGRMDCLLRVCTAMMLHAQADLLAGDFAANVKLLQRYPPTDINRVLALAAALPPAAAVLGGRC